MKQREITMLAAVCGALAVGFGAFGAHALKGILQQNGRLETYELAVRYQFYHTFGLLAVGILVEKFPSLKASAWFFLVGILIFSGSLYALALSNMTWWGAVTPFGGVSLILGWVSFFLAVMKGPR